MRTAEHALQRAQAAEAEKDRAIQEARDAKVKAAAAEEAAKKVSEDANQKIADKEAELNSEINKTQSERAAHAQLAADLRKKLEELQAAEALEAAGGGEGGRAASPAAGGRAASPAGGAASPAAGGRARVRIGPARDVQIPDISRSPSPVPGSEVVDLLSVDPSRAGSPDRSGRRRSGRSKTPTSFWKSSVPTSYTSQGEAQFDLTASRPPSRPHSRKGSPRPDGAGAAKRGRHGQ